MHEFGQHFGEGKAFEERIADLIGARMYLSGDGHDRDAGDMAFEGRHIECKWDGRFDSTGNMAVEFADDHRLFAHCTGVGKAVTMGTNAVYVHALGTSGMFAVYNPSDMVAFLGALASKRPRVVPAKNRGYVTWSVILAHPEQAPQAPLVLATEEDLAEAIRAVGDPWLHRGTDDVLGMVRALKPALPGDLRIKAGLHSRWTSAVSYELPMAA